MALAGHPPHGSVRAAFPHTALTSDETVLGLRSSVPVHPATRATWCAGSVSGPVAIAKCFPWSAPLPSTDSAGGSGPPLFVGFFGTMGLSDSPATYTSDVWHLAFSDRSVSKGVTDVTGVSRLPREKFPTVPVVLDSVGFTANSPISFVMTVAFPYPIPGRPPQKNCFGAQYTARLYPCERFAASVTLRCASLGAEATG